MLAKQGKYIAAFAPFGYQKSEDDKHMLVPDPVTAPVVQLIFELAIKRHEIHRDCKLSE